MNERSALELLLTSGPLTRTALGRLAGLSKVTASQLLVGLQTRGLVEVVGTRSTGRGPSAELYAVRAGCSYAVGVEVRHGRIDAVVADITGDTVGRASLALAGSDEPAKAVHDVAMAAVADAGLTLAAVRDLVVAVPGVVDPGTGDLVRSYDWPHWCGAVLPRLSDHLQCEVSLENNVNLAAVAEQAEGAGQGVDDLVVLWVGRGVGLAVVLGGRVRRGAHGGAGEIGYLPTGAAAGTPRHALDHEAFHGLVGADAVCALAADYGLTVGEAAEAVRVALAEGATDFVRVLAERLAFGVAATCSIVDPALVILAGDVGLAGGSTLAAEVGTAVGRIVPVAPAVAATSLAGDAVLRGAVITAVERARLALFSSS